MTTQEDVQDQFDIWFPHGAIVQWDSSGLPDKPKSFISPYIRVEGGTLTQPQLWAMGSSHEGIEYYFDVLSWKITQQDPFVLQINPKLQGHPYLLGARVPESVYSTPEFQEERRERQAQPEREPSES